MKALVIVDMQNDFLPGGALAVKEGDLIIPLINQLQEKYELVIATQDWHPYNHQSFVTQHADKQVYQKIKLRGVEQTLWPEHCVQESWGAAFTSDLNQQKIAAIFRKGMDRQIDTYSGFFDNDKMRNTGLFGYLKDKNVAALDICGLAADFCVFYTAMDALALGFTTTILLDATKAINPENFVLLEKEFIAAGGKIA